MMRLDEIKADIAHDLVHARTEDIDSCQCAVEPIVVMFLSCHLNP